MPEKNEEKTEMPLDYFIANVYPNGDSLVVTIPANHIKFSGIKAGDLLKVYYKKAENKEEKQE